MTDYKQLCAELSGLLANLHSLVSVECPRALDEDSGGAVQLDLDIEEVLERARAALVEPEPSTERPDRLRVGDVWEFWTEVNIKGKPKPVEILLQWEVVGWHNGEYAWELQSLDGEHKAYLMEFAPSYEEMRFIRSNETKAQ